MLFEIAEKRIGEIEERIHEAYVKDQRDTRT